MSGKTFITYSNQWRIWLYKWVVFSKRFSISHYHGFSTHYPSQLVFTCLKKIYNPPIDNHRFQLLPLFPCAYPSNNSTLQDDNQRCEKSLHTIKINIPKESVSHLLKPKI